MKNIIENTLLPIHFDVDAHSIDLDTFVSTATGIQNIARKLNTTIFENPPKLNILVFPPKPGSLLELLGILLDSGTIELALALKIVDSKEVRALIKGLTGHDYTYYSQKLGECLRDAILGILKKKSAEISDMQKTLPRDSFVREELETMMVEKNKIYKKWSENKKIRSVGFSEKSEFSVSAKDFPSHFYAKEPLSPSQGEKYKRMILTIVEAVTIRESHAKWTFENRRSKEKERFSAEMADTDFRRGFFDKGLYALKATASDDTIDAYVGYRDENGKFSDYKILRVYKFNEKFISEPPHDLDFEEILEDEDPSQQILRF